MTTKTFNRKNKYKQHENIVYRVKCSVQRTYNMDYALKLPYVDLYNDKGWRKWDAFLWLQHTDGGNEVRFCDCNIQIISL